MCFARAGSSPADVVIFKDTVAEWLRRWTANPFPSGIAGSSPASVVNGSIAEFQDGVFDLRLTHFLARLA